MTNQQLDSALDLLLRLPPQQVTRNLFNIYKLTPDLQSDLEAAIDQPLRTAIDTRTNREYIACEYNRDGEDSYRSPWSNEYEPPLGKAIKVCLCFKIF